jgi:hypothetical protein
LSNAETCFDADDEKSMARMALTNSSALFEEVRSFVAAVAFEKDSSFPSC